MPFLSGLVSRFRRDGGQLQPPTAMADGVCHGPAGTWAWVVIPPRSTDELPSGALAMATADAGSDLRRLVPPGADFHFKVQWARWSGAAYLDAELREDMNAGAAEFTKLQAGRIEDTAFPRRLVLFGVRMDVADVSPAAAAAARARKVAGTATAGRELEDSLELTLTRVRRWQARMADSSFAARPATTQELAWSLRHDLRRTVDWIPSTAVAAGGQMARLRSAQVVPEVHHVEVSTDTGTRYLRMIVPTETGFPTADLELPGGEWLKTLTILGSEEDSAPAPPAEVSIRGRNVPQLESKKVLQSALSLAKEQERTAGEGLAEEAPELVAEARATLAMRLKEVQAGHVGMVQDTPCWIVEADDLDVLERRCQALIDFYGGMGISVWAPPNIQDLLWKQTVIGDRRRVTEFEQFRPSSTLMGGWFHGGSQVGPAKGSYVARNEGSTPGPFLSRLTDAQLDGSKITWAFLGGSGSGKSTSLGLALVAEVLSVNAWAALVDFKGDLGGIPTLCETYGGNVHRVSTASASSGSLCPFRYVADPQTAASMAVDNLTATLPRGRAADVESKIRSASRAVAARPDPADRSTAAIIDVLTESADPVVRALGVELADLASDPLARPVAGPPDLSAKQIPTGPGLVYVRLNDLRWPGSETAQENWQAGERLTAMLLKAVFTYVTYMSSQVVGIPKIVALTELHLITKYDFGRDLVATTARMGRALDTNMLLDTQGCAELLRIDGLEEQISATYAFRVDSAAEATAQARMLGVEPESGFILSQARHLKGACLIRDPAGQIGRIRFDLLTPEIGLMLKTTPERTKNVLAGSAVGAGLEDDLDPTEIAAESAMEYMA